MKLLKENTLPSLHQPTRIY